MIEAALQAGAEIMKTYRGEIAVDEKSDGSPVTLADRIAEERIGAILAVTGLPMLAEESAGKGRTSRLGPRYFVVDPLDGTKEFIKRNGEFTVNIALVKRGLPVAGIVYAPALGTLFWGASNGAFEYRVDGGRVGDAKAIAVADRMPPLIVASRTHGSAFTGEIEKALGTAGSVSVGSSLKFCLVARGDAQIYPRMTPTCEWDTAAGQAVLEAAGGAVRDLSGARLAYGKAKDRFLNGYFFAASNARLAERAACLVRTLTGDGGMTGGHHPGVASTPSASAGASPFGNDG
jgi:3'(2'),5'-bisphosphate nucleotidase